MKITALMHGTVASTINTTIGLAGIDDRSINDATMLDPSATGNTVTATTNTQIMASGDK
jgi:hypothetical protein